MISLRSHPLSILSASSGDILSSKVMSSCEEYVRQEDNAIISDTREKNNTLASLKANWHHVLIISLFCLFSSIALALTITVLVNHSYKEAICVRDVNGDLEYLTEVALYRPTLNSTMGYYCWINHSDEIKLYNPLPHSVKVLAIVFWCLTALLAPVYAVLAALMEKRNKNALILARHAGNNDGKAESGTEMVGLKTNDVNSWSNSSNIGDQTLATETAAEFVIE